MPHICSQIYVRLLVGQGIAQFTSLCRPHIVRFTHNITSSSLVTLPQAAMSLRTLLGWVGVTGVTGLHNGGNDAYFTLAALLKLCELQPL